MLAGDDPWLAVGSPVDAHDQHHAPARLPAQGPGNAQAPQADPYAQLAEPAPQGDKSTTVPDEYIGGFSDQLPKQVAYQMSPQDEAAYSEILHHGTLQDAIKFLADRNRPPPDDPEWFAARDNAIKNGGKVGYSITYRLPTGEEVRAGGADTGGAAGATTRGALDSLTLGAAGKLGTLGRTVSDQMHGSKNSFGDDWNIEADRREAVIQEDQAKHPWAKIAGQIEGGAVLPMGLEGVAARAEANALNAGKSLAEAHQIGLAAVRNRVVAASGGYGAAHGAISADSPGEAVTGALTEGGLGAASAGVLGAAGKGLAARAESKALASHEGRDVFEAAQRQGIDVLPADVGGPMTRRATSMTAQSIVGGQPIISASQRMTAQSAAARDRIAETFGQALEPEAAGNAAAAGARKYISTSGAQGSGFYTAAEKAAGDTRITAPAALAKLDEHIAELSDTPGGADGLDTLQALRADLAKGNLSPAGVRRMRTSLRDQFIKDGLRGSDLERRVGQVVDAAATDVTQGLRDAGKPQAASLFAKADAAWRDRANTIDTVMKPLIGTREAPRSGEQIIKTLTADLQGNNARAVKFLRALPPEEQAATKASIIGALGRAKGGGQNAEGDAFSLSTFLTNWSQIGKSAKAAYFGPEGTAALDDLAKVAQGAREAQGYANRSNTGGAVGNLLTLATGLGGVTTFGKTIAAQYGMGRLLASPRFARWLARAPRTVLSTPAYVDRLSRIARAEPAIANEVLQLQQRLTSAFTGSSMPTRLAAQEPSNEPDGGQGNAGDQQPENQSLQP